MRNALIANVSQPFQTIQKLLIISDFTLLNKILQFTFRFETDIQKENPIKIS